MFHNRCLFIANECFSVHVIDVLRSAPELLNNDRCVLLVTFPGYCYGITMLALKDGSFAPFESARSKTQRNDMNDTDIQFQATYLEQVFLITMGVTIID